jgi:TolB-like protein
MMKTTSWILILTMLLHGAGPLAYAQEGGQAPKRIALVDFRNLTGDPDYDRYQQSIPDQIQTALAGTGNLRLVERGQLESALQELKLGMDAIVDDQTAVQLGRVLQANAIVTGSYQREGSMLQITARVIDVETSEVITGVIERSRMGGDVFNAIDRLTDRLLENLRNHRWGGAIFQPQETKKKSKTWLWIGIGAVVLAGGALVLAGGGGDDGSGESDILVDPPARPGN